MNTRQKKALYESIMKSVAKTVKKALNESSADTISLKNACKGYFRVQKKGDEYYLYPINPDITQAMEDYLGYSTDGEIWFTVAYYNTGWAVIALQGRGSSTYSLYEAYLDDADSSDASEFINNILVALGVNDDDDEF